jgi:hypothetical protein
LDYQLGSVLGLPGLPEAGPGTAPGLMGPGLELAAVGHFVEGPEGKAGPLKVVGRH